MFNSNGLMNPVLPVAPSSDLRYYEFFAGAGLVRLALEPVWQCAWANDISQRKAEVYKANFGSDEIVVKDVSDVTASDLPTPVEMAWASFPCQHLTLAGWPKGMSAERSGAFWPFWRLMRDLFDSGQRPPIIVIENVVGLLYDQDFSGLCESLAALGLQFGAMVIDARHFLPQSRPRVFIVAVDRRIDCSQWMMSAPGESPWFPAPVQVAAASLSPPARELWRWWNVPTPLVTPPELLSLIEDDARGVSWHTPAETGRMVTQMMTEMNRAKVDLAIESGRRSVGLLYKRTRGGIQRAEVRFDGIAGCLRTPQGGSSRQVVLTVDKGQVRSRLLSAREAARLMGAPDSFHLPKGYNDAYRAMGDGVAVPVVEFLAGHLLTPVAFACRAERLALSWPLAKTLHSKLSISREATETLAAEWDVLRQ